MAPTVKLHYFNLRVRAEPIRWIFSYSGQEWVDHRIEFPDWPALKDASPGGQLPYIDVDGRGSLTQTYAICRYLAKQCGLYGSNPVEAAEIDSLVDYTLDAAAGYSPYVKAILAKDHEKARIAGEEYSTTTIKPFLVKLENCMQMNEAGQDFLVGGQLSWADFILTQLLDEIVRLKSDLLESYPLLKALRERVMGLKGIKEYLTTRPDSVV